MHLVRSILFVLEMETKVHEDNIKTICQMVIVNPRQVDEKFISQRIDHHKNKRLNNQSFNLNRFLN